MRFLSFIIILGILLLLPFSMKARSQDFGQSVSLFTDIKAHRVGDLLTVTISENLRASNQVQTKSEKSTSANIDAGPGVGTLGFLPLLGFDGSGKSTHDGKGENTRSGSVRGRMTVTVVAVRPNGDLIIEGTKTILISGDKEQITVTGVVRAQDITAENTIESSLIADAQISYTGKGAANTAARPGFITRVINWLF